jgi:hypothetical protein
MSTKSPVKGAKKPVSINNLSRIMELMMDKCCPMDLAGSDGIGTDNMTAMIIEFVRPSAS